METVKPFEGWTAKLYDNSKWYEKVVLWFREARVHISSDGWVVYKPLGRTLYIYGHGHFVYDDPQAEWTGGAEKPWEN